MKKENENELKNKLKKLEEIEKKLTYTTALAWFNCILLIIVIFLLIN